MLMRWPEDGVGKEVCLASEVDAELARLTTERDAAIARAERAERVAVWAARHSAEVALDDEDRWRLLYFGSADEGLLEGSVYCDTDAETFRALVEACEGGTNV